jgi:hypothetical protein
VKAYFLGTVLILQAIFPRVFATSCVPEGYRAVTLRVPAANQTSAFLSKSNSVDLVISGDKRPVLWRNLTVLDVATMSSPETKKIVVLLVTPQEAAQLILFLARRGDSSLSFRPTPPIFFPRKIHAWDCATVCLFETAGLQHREGDFCRTTICQPHHCQTADFLTASL